MGTKRRRFTVVAVAIWALALVAAGLVAPIPAEAKTFEVGWMTYAPGHPNGCVPLPWDCYVVKVYPD
jgi:hypothetical protein